MTNVIDTKLAALLAMAHGPWIIACDQNRVNLDDLINSLSRRPGSIVRVDGDVPSALKIIQAPGRDEVFDCIAGWISEE